MYIEDDYTAYRLAQLAEIAEQGKGGRFMCQYWRKTGKLQLLPQLIDDKCFDTDLYDIAYVVAGEEVCVKLKDGLDKLLQSCKANKTKSASQADLLIFAEELVAQLKKLNKLNTNSSWLTLYNNLSTIVSKALTVVDKLNAGCVANNVSVFDASCDLEDFFVKGKVNFDSRKGAYFVLKQRGNN